MRFMQARWMRGVLGIVTGLFAGFVVGLPIVIAAHDLLPIISFVAPSQNSTVTGAATFYIRSDSAGLVGLQFQIDGQNFGSEITSGACRATWDSSQKPDGLHTIQATGRDQYGNLTLAPPVTVLVSNPVFVPPPPTPTPGPTRDADADADRDCDCASPRRRLERQRGFHHRRVSHGVAVSELLTPGPHDRRDSVVCDRAKPGGDSHFSVIHGKPLSGASRRLRLGGLVSTFGW